MATHDPHNSEEDRNPTERPHNTATSNASSTASSVKNVFVFRNGDTFQPCKKIVLNNRQLRTWDIFLEHVTQTVNPIKGAVRDIVTPRGGRKVNAFEDMNDKGIYVALARGERFQKMDGYSQQSSEKAHSPTTPRKNNVVRLAPIVPVLHNSMYASTSSRFAEQPAVKAITIKVYRNGDEFTPAIIVLLKPHEQRSMELVYRAVEERVVLPSNRAIRKIYTLAGVRVFKPDELEDAHYYVAASLELFISRPYGQQLPVLIIGKADRRSQVKYLNNPKTPAKETHRDGNQTSRDPNTNRSQKQQNGQVTPRKPAHDNATKQKAATQIQASFRGYKTRKELAETETRKPLPIKHDPKQRPARPQPKPSNQQQPNKSNQRQPQQKLKSPPTAQQKEKAATTIQASFKGFQTRKTLAEKDANKPLPIKRDPARKPAAGKENAAPKQNNRNNQQKNQNQKPQQNKKPPPTPQQKEKAATTIQASFKGFKTRKEIAEKETKKPLPVKPAQQNQKNAQPKQNPSQQNQKPAQKNKKTATPQEKEKAATTIQASFKGFKTRKELAEKETKKPLPVTHDSNNRDKKPVQQNKKPATAQEKEKAATAIQASYKGFKTRKELAEKETKKPLPVTHDPKNRNDKSKKDQTDNTKKPTDKEKAATTIQASYKGYKTRQDVAQKDGNKSKQPSLTEKEKAAQTIQAGYKGYKTREDVKAKDAKPAQSAKEAEASQKINASLQSYKTRKELAEQQANKEKKQQAASGSRA